MTQTGAPLDIPCVSLARFMTERFDILGDRVALVDPATDRAITYKQLSDQVRRLSRGLASIGFKKADILCNFLPNVVEYPIVFYAVASLGGVLQATNPLCNTDELQNSLKACGTRFLITVPALLPVLDQVASHIQVITIGEVKGYTNYYSLVDDQFSTDPIPDCDIEPKQSVCAYLFSSGTTGKPKAVQLTQHAFVANVKQILADFKLSQDDVFVTFLPFFHIYGLGPILTTGLYCGAKNIVMARFQPQDYLNNVQRFKATVLHQVPPVLVLFSKMADISRYNLSSVHTILCGAAPLSREVESRTLEIFNIKSVSQGYGMTECQVTHLMQGGQYKFGSVGKVVPGAECKIVSLEGGAALSEGEDGEVLVRGPSLMKSYLANPGATADIFVEEGWMRTGDIGHIDSDGYLFIVDRLKELIKYKGFQVAPAELEDILLSHPDVADVGVIGVPDVEAGELPKAFVVRKTGSGVSEIQLQDFVAGKVSGTKKLRGGVTFLQEIPKSASGKILRRVLRDRERTSSSRE